MDVTGVSGLVIDTTSTSQAIPQLSYVDNLTGARGSSAGQQYTGPVNNLQSQDIWASSDGVSLTSSVPNAFLQGGAGSNVLDGGFGSSIVTGATGADGRDQYLLPGLHRRHDRPYRSDDPCNVRRRRHADQRLATFAGLGLADAQSKLSLIPGSVGGRSDLCMHYNAWRRPPGQQAGSGATLRARLR